MLTEGGMAMYSQLNPDYFLHVAALMT